MRRLLPLAALLSLLPFSAFAQALPAPEPPLTLAQVMADPDWIGNQVEDYWWTWDSRHAQYERKRDGAIIRDTWQVPVDGSVAPRLVEPGERATLDASGAVYDATRSRMAFVRNGDLFVRDADIAYFDGDSPNATWTGTPHASTSILRDARTLHPVLTIGSSHVGPLRVGRS